MTFKELKNQDTTKLQHMLAEQRENLRQLRFKDSNKQLKNVRQIRKVRQDIARILTSLNLKKKAK